MAAHKLKIPEHITGKVKRHEYVEGLLQSLAENFAANAKKERERGTENKILAERFEAAAEAYRDALELVKQITQEGERP